MRKTNFILFLFFICHILFAQQYKPKDYILVLHSINFSETWTHGTYEAIKTNFAHDNIETKGEELQIPTLHSLQDIENKLNYLKEKYPNPPKIIVCIGDPAWLICRPLFDKEWKDIPSLICYSRELAPATVEGVIKRELRPEQMVATQSLTRGYNVTSLKQPLYIKETINTIRDLQPEMKQVVFICDNRYISILTSQDIENVVKKDFPGLQLKVLSTPQYTTENLLDELSSYGKETGIIYYSWFISKNKGENHYLVDNVQKMTNSFSNPPVFLIIDLGLETGNFAGGHYISIEDFGNSVTSTIRKILSGTEARSIPSQIGGTARTYLDYQHLLNHGINPSSYPRNAIYYQQPPTFLEKYKYLLIGTFIIICLLITIAVLRIRLFLQKQKQRKKEQIEAARIEALSRKYRLILKASRTIIWIWDTQEQIIECDQEYFESEIFHQDAKYTLQVEELFSYIHPKDKQKVQNAYNLLIMGSVNIIHHEFRIWRPEMKKYDWLECYATISQKDANGKITKLVGSSVTITERKKMEAELQEKEKIEEANRLKTAFLANMSHEIRTPLNTIVGFSNLIAQSGEATPEEKQEFCKIISTNNDLLLQLINDILDLSKIEAGKLDFKYSNIDVSELMSRLAQTFKTRTKEGVVLKCVLPEQTYFIHSEKNRLTQVITNFLTNACKFTFNGSITMGYEATRNGLRFYVTDTGKGIAKENIPHVFERFAKFDSFIQGTGLGLSISQTIIQNLGGKIGVESIEGKGSTFWFTIPVKKQQTSN